MPLITLDYSDNLAASVDATSTHLRLNDQADVCDTVTTFGKYVILSIFDARHAESVLVTGCELVEGVQHLIVQRGFRGTAARAWPSGSCVCTVDIIDACSEDDGAEECHKPLAGVTVEGCIEIINGDTCTPTIRLRTSGVTPIDNDCIRINECGLVEWVSPTFPADCVPVFEPCAPCGSCGGGGGGSVAAGDVTYNGGANTYVLGPDVASALTQADIALTGLAAAQTGFLTGLVAGTGIVVGGALNTPTVSLAPVFGAPGVYDGFTINQFGQITSYNVAGSYQHVGTAPINVLYNSGSLTYTYSVNPATFVGTGVVQLLDPAFITAEAIPVGSDGYVITWAGMLAVLDKWLPELNTVDGLSGSTGPFNTDRTITLDIVGVNTQVTASDADYFVMSDAGGNKYKIALADVAREVGGAYASGIANPVVGSLSASKGVVSITYQAVGDYLVELASVGGMPTAYIVHVTAISATTPTLFSYVPLSATQFRIRAYTHSGVDTDVSQIGFTVVAAD